MIQEKDLMKIAIGCDHGALKLKNALIQQGRSTDCVDELIVKFLEAPVRKIRVN